MDNLNRSSSMISLHNISQLNLHRIYANHTYRPDRGENYDSLYDVPMFLVVLLSIFYGTISILAVAGNALVMWIVATSRRMQNVTNCFIANLALADIVIGLFAIPFQFQAALLQRWSLPAFMCAFCPFVQVLSVTVSVFTLTAIAVDRHKAILDPLSARPSKLTAKLIIGGIWAAGAALASPMALALRVRIVEESDLMNPEIIHRKPFCSNVHFSASAMLSYRIVLFLLQYLTPLCVISFVYARMALKLWGSRAPGNAQYHRDANLMKNKKKVIKMLFIVVALFAVCWLPLQTYNVLQDTFPRINEYRYINIIFFCCDWLAMSNSCYNPFIYGIYNEKFKREFKLRFPGGKKWNQPPTNDSYDLDKTQTLRFSNSFRSHVDWRRSQSNIQMPMVTYSVHFCANPCGELKRTRFVRNSNHNCDSSESSYNPRNKQRTIHYSVNSLNSTDPIIHKVDKLQHSNKTRMNKTSNTKANHVPENFDESLGSKRKRENDSKENNTSGCCGKKFHRSKKSRAGEYAHSHTDNESYMKDVIINTKHNRQRSADEMVCFDQKETRKRGMEFNAGFANSDNSHSGGNLPYYRGVVMQRPTQSRCFSQGKWKMEADCEHVETDIYIFPEGDKSGHNGDEAATNRLPEDLCL